jgi:excisionase family DNA binding protein
MSRLVNTGDTMNACIQTLGTSVENVTAERSVVLGERISYTLRNAANVLDISTATLRRLEKAGKLRFIKVGGRTLVDARSLHALVA